MDSNRSEEFSTDLSKLPQVFKDVLSSGLRDSSLFSFYQTVLAESINESEALTRSLKEIADIKFALDRAAIVAITDSRGIIRHVNDKFCELSQYRREELIGKTHKLIKSNYHSLEFFQEFWQTITAGRVWKGEVKNKAKDGSYYWVDTTVVPFLDKLGKPYQYLSIRFDITERKRSEEALQQSACLLQQQAQQLEKIIQELKHTQAKLIQTEKISSLGQMIAGIAHEINNPLSFISSNLFYANKYFSDLLEHLELYRQHFPQSRSEIFDHAEEIDIEFIIADLPKVLSSTSLGAERMREIILSLRNFSRSDSCQTQLANIHDGLDSTLMLLQHRLKSQPERPAILIVKEYGNLPLIECYPGQLNQVFMNLLANAIDALEESNQGRTYTEIERHPNIIWIRTEVLEDNRATIKIRDNGAGIPAAVQSRLFASCLTTKPVGKGTGLGLPISHQIITQNHQGQLRCISEVNQGTEFIIEIPLHRHQLSGGAEAIAPLSIIPNSNVSGSVLGKVGN